MSKHRSFQRPFATTTWVTIVALVASALTFTAVAPASASSVDASVGLDFTNAVDVLPMAPVGSSHVYRNVISGVDAIVTVMEISNREPDPDESFSRFDRIGGTDTRWIEPRGNQPVISSQYGSTTYKLEFVASADNSRSVILENLTLNAYDVDQRDRLEISHVSSYQLTSDTIVSQVENLGNNVMRFTASSASANNQPTDQLAAHSQGQARVQANLLSTSTLTIGLGRIGSGQGNMDLLFSASNVPWEIFGGQTTAPTSISLTPPETNSRSAAPAPPPQKQHVSTLNQTPAPGETVAMFGSYFEGVTEVFVGGVKVDIVSKSDNRVNIRMPRGLTGALDVELKSPLGSLLLPKHFTIGKLTAAGGQKATIVVGGFDPNSRKLTARMQARIDRWLERNSDLSTLTCTGFTSLPRRTTDVQLSTNRGTTACAYAKRQRPDVTTSVSQGVEDPRPGSNVRRVKLVLTR